MESVGGAEAEHVNGGLEEKAQEGLGLLLPSVADKENENTENGVDASQENGAKEGTEVGEGMKASGAVEGDGDGPAVAVPMESGHAKKAGAGVLGHAKKSGVQKGEVGKKDSAGVGRNQRPNLSQSPTFPSKGILTAGSRKSVAEVRSMKANSVGRRADVSQTAAISNGKISTSRSKLASVTKSRHLTVTGAKIGETPSGLTSKTLDVHRNTKSAKTPAQLKSDDDARSTTSLPSGAAAMRKSTGTAFAFRLDERAEKRKQFFMKLEEKIHAIEVEKTNQQEKSKEDQEAEIKQLRKSLTFKATPMPSFYKEPAPPKVELKKIPTTRPISPKLGRRKPSTTNPEVTSEGKAPDGGLRPGHSPSIKSVVTASTTVGVSATTKNPIRKSLAKSSSPKTTAKMPEAKPLDVKEFSDPDVKAPEAEVEAASIPNNLSEDHPPEFDQEPAGNAPVESKATIQPYETMIARKDVSVDG